MTNRVVHTPQVARSWLNWRHAVLGAVVFGSLAALLQLDPIAQPASYHGFADTRTLMGIPNALDVLSSLPFAIVGLLGVRIAVVRDVGPQRNAWIVLFAGVALVSLGSAYYHYAPSDPTLVWDRLPMTLGFMGLMAALMGEFVHERIGKLGLLPMLFVGLASVLYWAAVDDLRLYVWVQLVSLLLIPTVIALFKAPYTEAYWLLIALAWYALAKGAEIYDAVIFEMTGEILSGHAIKHVLSAAGCACIVVMLARRGPTR